MQWSRPQSEITSNQFDSFSASGLYHGRAVVRHDDVGRLGGGDVGIERPDEATANRPPTSWATTNPGTEAGAMPARVSENIRPTVKAGLAKLVELVNQYAAPM